MDKQKNSYKNPLGVQFYKPLDLYTPNTSPWTPRNVLEELKRRGLGCRKVFRSIGGITPVVTMYHWDLPEQLDWLDDEVVDYFLDYADFLFTTFPEVLCWKWQSIRY